MKFVLEVNCECINGDVAAELGRALRYWGGAMKDIDLSQPQRMDIYDSSYAQPIGYWELVAIPKDLVQAGGDVY